MNDPLKHPHMSGFRASGAPTRPVPLASDPAPQLVAEPTPAMLLEQAASIAAQLAPAAPAVRASQLADMERQAPALHALVVEKLNELLPAAPPEPPIKTVTEPVAATNFDQVPAGTPPVEQPATAPLTAAEPPAEPPAAEQATQETTAAEQPAADEKKPAEKKGQGGKKK